jgi:hypothetical protein
MAVAIVMMKRLHLLELEMKQTVALGELWGHSAKLNEGLAMRF